MLFRVDPTPHPLQTYMQLRDFERIQAVKLPKDLDEQRFFVFHDIVFDYHDFVYEIERNWKHNGMNIAVLPVNASTVKVAIISSGDR